MRVLLLSAGYGTRLGEATKKTPKPMIQVGDKPLIELIIDNLALHGLDQLIVNLHYLPEVVIKKIQSRALYYYEPKLLGHKGTIFALRKWLEGEPFMVINADTSTNVNYTEMILNHKPHTITVCMDEYRATGTWIYPADYFTNPDLPLIPYRPPNLDWQDIGTPERLEKARAKYA